jgi:hypothetical protein
MANQEPQILEVVEVVRQLIQVVLLMWEELVVPE